MKIRTMLLVAALTLGSIMTVSAFAHSITAGPQNSDSMSASTARAKKVMLQCRNYGGQQDVSKNPDIINNTSKTVPAGKTLHWSASDGDKGSVVLDKALAPGGKVGVTGTAGQSYTCTAWYLK